MNLGVSMKEDHADSSKLYDVEQQHPLPFARGVMNSNGRDKS